MADEQQEREPQEPTSSPENDSPPTQDTPSSTSTAMWATAAAPTRQLTAAEAAIIEIMKRNDAVVDEGKEDEGDSEQRHVFWDTQPMPHTAPEGVEFPEGPIAEGDLAALRGTPYNMPTGFTWSDVDVTDPTQRKELYDLLANNYVEDDDCLFRFDYSEAFLQWALTPPGSKLPFWLGVRSTKSSKLVAFISAVPAQVRARSTPSLDVVEINFLCVHKKLRSKRLAPVLIKEITRRVNHTNVWQAVYTAGVVLPVPVASARYHHRSLNPRKLIDVGFSRLPRGSTMARHLKNYKLPATTSTPNLREMKESDVEGVHALLTTYLQKFQLHVVFAIEEIAHWLLPREGVINSYVVEKEEGKITDLISFYHLPSSILNRNDTLHAAYAFYNVASSDWVDLMRDALILAKNCGSDVFNCLNLMENDEFLKDLKFGLGDGELQYYLYNWACGKEMQPSEVGIVLL